MSTAACEELKKSDLDHDWQVVHRFHKCQPSKGWATAVCGTKVELIGSPAGPEDTVCIMCHEISRLRIEAKLPCPLCGEYYARPNRWD